MEAELHDGTILEFPDGTDPQVIQATVKKMLGAPPLPEKEVGTMDRVRALSSGVGKGMANLAGLPVDTAENVINLAKAGYGTAATALGRPDLAPETTSGAFGGSEYIKKLMERGGVSTTNPNPQDPSSRILHRGGMIAGGSLVPGATAKQTLTAAAGGAVTGEALGDEWTGVGTMIPAAGAQALRGVNNSIAQPVASEIQKFTNAGATPTVGQATKNSFLRGMENVVSKFPGGAGYMQKFNEGQQAKFGEKLRTGVSGEDAGRTIEQGIKGEQGFLARTKQTWQVLDDAVAAKIPKSFSVVPEKTVQILDELTAPIKGAEATSAIMRTPRLAEINTAIRADLAQNPSLPYQSIRELRSKVGSLLDDSLATGIPNGELKKLYGALSEDLETAATNAGAGKEFTRQNNYYRARMDRIETVLEKVVGKGKQPEDIFKTFYPKDPDQANKVRAIMRSLNPSERQTVTDAVVSRLGKAPAGKQDEFGEVFSTGTFLSNWNKMSGGAKVQLFPDTKMRMELEQLAKASFNIREGKDIMQNTASFAAAGVYAAPVVAVATLNPAVLLGAASATGFANIGARMLTNPKIVEWLARSTKIPTNAAAPHLARLAVIYNNTKDEKLKEELDTYMQSISQQNQQ